MFVRRLLYSKFGKNVISILLGLGLATLFRKVCNERNCMVFKAPELKEIKEKTFKFDGKCYKYEENSTSCKNTKKRIVDFA
jgi:hypothetical protein|tara:strand:- start:150 stop:392 length:243 start_codon:yes stop_codon:yes gene_type:complete